MNKYERFLEKKKLYFSNATLVLIVFMSVGYFFKTILPQDYVKFFFDPSFIVKGEVWRLVSWLMVTNLNFTSVSNILLSSISLFFYYYIGRNVENELGKVKYNVFLQRGILLTILGHFLYFLALYVLLGPNVTSFQTLANSPNITNTYLFQSLFMIWAYINPEERINIYFVIPVKIKFMALVYAVITIFHLITGNTGDRITIIMAFLNLVIFYFSTKRKTKSSKKIIPKTYIHKCAICGKTSDDSSDFRFCSKCTGQKEYCLDHIKNHTHS